MTTVVHESENALVLTGTGIDEAAAAQVAEFASKKQMQVRNVRQMPCPKCEGCKQIANDEEGSPWSRWANLPPGSDVAVKAGIVKPIDCPVCDGKGEVLVGEAKPMSDRMKAANDVNRCEGELDSRRLRVAEANAELSNTELRLNSCKSTYAKAREELLTAKLDKRIALAEECDIALNEIQNLEKSLQRCRSELGTARSLESQAVKNLVEAGTRLKKLLPEL